MKTTVDLPDPVFRKAKARAAERGISLKRFITEAVESRLASQTQDSPPAAKPWMALLDELPRVPKKMIATIESRVAEADAADLKFQKDEHP
ncbi:hypothetical protein [Luteolibacter sp. Populi]|uniref:hypothetical protein n=1 Tax=Luteolibacter sp. Populi TaxID=3230487 RepID=UPI003466F340